MKRHLFIFCSAMVMSSLALQAQTQSQPTISDYWNDPEFVKSFMGSYGFLPEIEPKINQDEVELFRDLLEVIKVNPQAAAVQLQQSINAQSSAALVFVLGNLYLQSRDLDAAIQAYQQALDKFPNYRRVFKNMGVVYLQQEQYDLAIKHFAKAIELGDRDGKTYGRLGFSYMQMENLTAAEEAFRQAILHDPQEQDWKQGLAECLLQTKAFQEAQALFSDLITLNPDDATFWRFQANTYIGQGEPLKAAANLEVVKGLGQANVQDLILLGDIYLKQLSVFDVALEAYTLAIRKEQTSAVFDAAFNSVDIFYYFEEYEKTKALIALIRKTFSAELTESDELALLVASAKVARAEDNDSEAVQLLESIIERDPLNGEALIELAKYYEAQGDMVKAEMKLKHAQNIEGFKFKAFVQHAQIMVKQKKFDAAIPLLKQALDVKDDDRIKRYLERIIQANKVT